MVIIPTIGETRLLQYMLGKQTPVEFLAKLFVNDYVPVDGTTQAHLVEMTTHGYAPKSLSPSLLTISHASTTADGQYPTLAWTFTGAPEVGVFGWYAIDPDGTLLWVERFDTEKSIQDSGDQIRVTCKVQLGRAV